MIAFDTIVAATDFSAPSEEALGRAAELAKQFGANLHVVHVYQIPVYGGLGDYGAIQGQLLEAVRDGASKGLADTVARLRARGVKVESHLREGFAADRIAELAREVGADLIVMGTHGRTGLPHFLLGSVAERTLRTAPCSVLTVRAKAT
jgi:nucleotide-binding universal stress UspA family protein